MGIFKFFTNEGKFTKNELPDFVLESLLKQPTTHIETPEPPQTKFIIGIDPYQQEETGDSHSWIETKVKEAENRLKTESDIMGVPYLEQEIQMDKLNLGWYKKFSGFKKEDYPNTFMSPLEFNNKVLGHPEGYKNMSNEEFQKEIEERTEYFKLDTSEEIVKVAERVLYCPVIFYSKIKQDTWNNLSETDKTVLIDAAKILYKNK